MRCGRGGLWRVLAALLLTGLATCLAGGAGAQPAPPGAPVLLRDAAGAVDAAALGSIWIDPEGTATIAQVSAASGRARFQPARAGQIHSLGAVAALWMHYRLARPASDRHDWLIEFPMPLIDRVTVYQPAGGGWHDETAGDTLAVDRWPEGGRHPHFRLGVQPGQVQDVYVRIRHTSAADIPVLLASEASHDQRIQVEYLGLGTTFGALLLLIAACLAQSWVYRDAVYAWYALYALLMTLAVASYTGVAAHLLWPGFGLLEDAPTVILSFLAAAAALLFVRNLTALAARQPVAGRVVYGLGLAGIVLAGVAAFMPKMLALGLLAVYVVGATGINVATALAAWRRGDVVGMWVFAAYVPLAISVALSILRLFGWIPVSFGTQYAVVVALAIEVPLLLIALSVRSRERHGAEIREQALSTQDPLTGLLALHLFHDRLRQVVARQRRHREGAAVVFIDLINYARIKQVHGPSVADQSVLRTVIKLRRLLRDVDTVSRVGEARFGVILEGVNSRAAVTDRAARLIAAGLMPLAGLKPEVFLQFHIAAIVLEERCMDAPELADELSALLGSMSPRTRRPIRFVAAESTQPVGGDSSLFGQDDEHARVPGAAAAT